MVFSWSKKEETMRQRSQHNLLFVYWQEFLSFIGTLWGILTLASVFLPLFNYFLRVIPVQRVEEGGVLYWFSIGFFTVLSVFLNVFILLGAFAYRGSLNASSDTAAFQRQSWTLFAIGAIAILVYLAGYFFLHDSSSFLSGCNVQGFCRLVAEAILLFLYVSFFAYITRAFALLNLAYYLHHVKS